MLLCLQNLEFRILEYKDLKIKGEGAKKIVFKHVIKVMTQHNEDMAKCRQTNKPEFMVPENPRGLVSNPPPIYTPCYNLQGKKLYQLLFFGINQ